MTRYSRRYMFGVMAAIPVFSFGGCQQAVRIPARLELGQSLGQFQVTAGVPKQNPGTLTVPNSSITIGSGTLQLDPDDISFSPADSGGSKGRTNYQGGGTFTVTAAIAAIEDVDTVCDTPVDEYGPFSVTLDENNAVTGIEPDFVNLTQSTIELINGGSFSICLTVESTVDGTVTIDALSFNLGL